MSSRWITSTTGPSAPTRTDGQATHGRSARRRGRGRRGGRCRRRRRRPGSIDRPDGEPDGEHADDAGDDDRAGRSSRGPPRRRRCGGRRGQALVGRRGRRQLGLVDLEAEQLDVGVADEQHGRRPLDLVDLAVDRLAGLGDGGVDRVLAADEVGVELLGEQDRRVVADLELHGHDGRHAEVDQRRGHPGERVGERGPGALAGVEDDEPQDVLVGQQVGEQRLVDLDRAGVVAVLEVQRRRCRRR